jgi:hypothetical protein
MIDESDDGSLERPKGDTGCVSRDDLSLDSGSLCDFSCMYGFCSESLCECIAEDEMEALPPKLIGIDIVAYDQSNFELTRLCMWACQYVYCPDNICVKTTQEVDNGIVEVGDIEGMMNRTEILLGNQARCMIHKNGSNQAREMEVCKKVCKDKIKAAQEEGRTTNYRCLGFWPSGKTIP